MPTWLIQGQSSPLQLERTCCLGIALCCSVALIITERSGHCINELKLSLNKDRNIVRGWVDAIDTNDPTEREWFVF